MNTYSHICLDLDGTVYKGTEPILEAVDFIRRAQEKGYNPYFVTNNSSRTRKQQQEKLASFGIRADRERIMTSAIAVAKYCSENYAGARIMMIGEEGLEEALVLEGIQLTKKSPDVVIMGIDRGITYEKLAEATLAIRAGAHFLATNSDKIFPTERGFVPGNGSFVQLMETATGKSPIFIGKPESFMLELIQKQSGCKKEEMVMVGDNYDTDIQAGIRYGIDTIHVSGGVTAKQEIKLKEIQPTYVLDSLRNWEI